MLEFYFFDRPRFFKFNSCVVFIDISSLGLLTSEKSIRLYYLIFKKKRMNKTHFD